MPSKSVRLMCSFFIAFLLVVAPFPAIAQSSFQQSSYVDGGTLSWTVTESTAPCGPSGSGSSYAQYQFSTFEYNLNDTTYPLNGSGSAYIQDNGSSTYGCPPTGPQPAALPIPLPSSLGDAQINFVSEDYGYGRDTVVATGTYDPLYKVVSILYSPPGNQSAQGYADSTTDGSSSQVGSSFTYSHTLTFSSGTGNSMRLTLKSSTADCNENVTLHENTLFHTFVFQVPNGDYGCN